MIVLAGLVSLLPIWIVVVAIGLGLLSFPERRHLSAYFIVGATSGFIGAEALSITVMIGLGALGVHGPELASQTLLVWGYIAGLASGAVLGIAIGIALAKKFNRGVRLV